MTDAINSAGGTTIKYVDTKTTVDITGYGKILGAMFKPGYSNSSSMFLILFCANARYCYYVGSYIHGSTMLTFSSSDKIDIRVFYY